MNNFSVNPPYIFTIDQKIAKMFCKAFYVRYQNMYYVDYVGFPTCSQLFWEPCCELFLVNNPVLHSVNLPSVNPP